MRRVSAVRVAYARRPSHVRTPGARPRRSFPPDRASPPRPRLRYGRRSRLQPMGSLASLRLVRSGARPDRSWLRGRRWAAEAGCQTGGAVAIPAKGGCGSAWPWGLRAAPALAAFASGPPGRRVASQPGQWPERSATRASARGCCTGTRPVRRGVPYARAAFNGTENKNDDGDDAPHPHPHHH